MCALLSVLPSVCVCVSGCFTKTTHYLLALHSRHNIMIMHCDSFTPGPSAFSRDFSVENFLADPSLPLLRRCLSLLIPLFCTKTAHNYCLSILHVLFISRLKAEVHAIKSRGSFCLSKSPLPLSLSLSPPPPHLPPSHMHRGFQSHPFTLCNVISLHCAIVHPASSCLFHSVFESILPCLSCSVSLISKYVLEIG